MTVASLPLEVDERLGPKRKLTPQDEGRLSTTKRRKHSPVHGEVVTRPRLSGEFLWKSYTKLPLCCSDGDKGIFGIQFTCLDPPRDGKKQNGRQRVMRERRSASETESLYQPERLSNVRDLRCRYGEAGTRAMAALLKSWGLQPSHWRERKLEVRYGMVSSMVEADGVFESPRTAHTIAYADFSKMEERRTKHITALLPSAKGAEEQARRELRTAERARIKPKKEEENAQVAAIMAAMVQRKLRNSGRDEPGGWAHVVGVGQDKIFVYRAWISRSFVERFVSHAGFEIRYRSIPLARGKEDRTAVRRLDSWLRECNLIGEEGGAVGVTN
ncbi:hypothetical protein K4F52_010311 [Lecanicillium sp. MT-2017a]|nr:hypothetical protein K4F52_010311 [Lecanicillium sp. MT-2017a]